MKYPRSRAELATGQEQTNSVASTLKTYSRRTENVRKGKIMKNEEIKSWLEKTELLSKINHEKGPKIQERNFFLCGEKFLIVAQFNWDTIIEGGSVYDHCVREIFLIDIVKAEFVGKSFERNLFRTTQAGVVGKKYATKIEEAKLYDNFIFMEFEENKGGKDSISVSFQG